MRAVLQVTAFEARVLQLQADEEVASVTAGPEAQAAAEAELQQAQEALLAVEQVWLVGDVTCCQSITAVGLLGEPQTVQLTNWLPHFVEG